MSAANTSFKPNRNFLRFDLPKIQTFQYSLPFFMGSQQMNTNDSILLEAICNGFERWTSQGQIIHHIELVASKANLATVLIECTSQGGNRYWSLIELHNKYYFRIGRKIWHMNFCVDGGPLPYRDYQWRPSEGEIQLFLSGDRDYDIGLSEVR